MNDLATKPYKIKGTMEWITIKEAIDKGMNLGRIEFDRHISSFGLACSGQLNMDCVILSGVNMKGANLVGVNLREANLTKSILQEANMTGVNLEMAILSHTNLKGADLARAVLIDTDLSGSDLSGANLEEAGLHEVNIRHVIGNGKEIKSADVYGRHIAYSNCELAIDGIQNSFSKWKRFSQDELNRMGIYFDISSIIG